MRSAADRLVLVLVVSFCVILGSIGVAVGVTGGTGRCPVKADAFGVSHQEARERSGTPGNERVSPSGAN